MREKPVASRLFDLNVGKKVLDNWETHHAIREVIANALDEQLLSGTGEIEITKDDQRAWHVRDFGRGLRIEHFTMNEDPEKFASDLPVIGKFGVGLKDALATFQRRGVDVLIRSCHGVFRLKRERKHGFEQIVTLHVEYADSPQAITGTDFVLRGASDGDVTSARALFLRFAGDQVLESTALGQVLRRGQVGARVYILGVLAAEEANLLFSYNVTSLTDSMKKRLNRERLNVGRTTYADRIKAILKSCGSAAVQDALVEQVSRRATGDQSDEMSWIEISQMALNLLNKRSRIVYLTEGELAEQPNVVANARTDGCEIVVITEQQKAKLLQQAKSGGPVARTLDEYVREYNSSFEYDFVDPADLTEHERSIFGTVPALLRLVGAPADLARRLRISTTMRVSSTDTEGIWDPASQTIVVKRTSLSSTSRFAGTFLHEVAHATSGKRDVSSAFESALTDYLGQVGAVAVETARPNQRVQPTVTPVTPPAKAGRTGAGVREPDARYGRDARRRRAAPPHSRRK